ncbi:MAG: FAD-dependent monooxygenase, partial [Chloroflexota bacterium]
MSPTSEYDAVVVGAGPAGATAAARLADAGLQVALIDRSAPPRDKPCGGGLSPKAYRLLEVDVSDLVMARPRSVVLSAPRSRSVSLESRAGEIWMVQRAAFDQRLVEHAQTRGATLLAGPVVRRVIPGSGGSPATVETDRGLIRAGAVVGADGADSVVARGAGLRPRRDREYVLALEAEGPR